jgi:hypothetical protein
VWKIVLREAHCLNYIDTTLTEHKPLIHFVGMPMKIFRRGWFLTAILLSMTLPALAQSQVRNIIGPDTYPDNINPLTGLPVADPAVLNRRPLLIKISDYPAFVRPQFGLNQADIVWEHLLSGGVTRFSAFYLGNDVPRVGPIRSGRLVDFELTRIYRSLFVYSGMSQGTIDILRGDGLVASRAISGSGPCPALCRFPQEGVALEHTLFGDTAALRERATELRITGAPVILPFRSTLSAVDVCCCCATASILKGNGGAKPAKTRSLTLIQKVTCCRLSPATPSSTSCHSGLTAINSRCF